MALGPDIAATSVAPNRSGSGPRDPRALAQAIAGTYVTWISASALGLLNVLIVARTLGPSGRGDVAFVMAVATLTAVSISLSVHEHHANMAVARPESRPVLAANSLVFAVLLGGVGAVAVFSLTRLAPGALGEVPRSLVILVLPTIPVVILTNYLNLLVRAEYRSGYANAALFLVPALTAAANGTLASTGSLTPRLAIGTWVVANALACALLIWCIARRSGGIGRPSVRLARQSVGFGLRAHGGVVMATGSFRLDQWLLGALAGSRELGLYSVAVAWAETLFFLPSVIQLVARPDMASGEDADSAGRTAKVTRIALLVSLPLVLLLIVAAPLLCVGVFGGEFNASIDDLRVLALGGIGIVIFKILGTALVARGRPLLDTAALSVAFVTTIVLDLLLIPSHGGLGAAVASTIAYTLAGVAAAAIFLRTFGGQIRDFLPSLAEARELARRVRLRGEKSAPRDARQRRAVAAHSATIRPVDLQPPLRVYLAVVRRNLPVIGIAVIAAAAAAFLVTRATDPTYRAESALVVGQDGGPFKATFGGSPDPFTQTVSSLLESQAVASSVIQTLGIDESPSGLLAGLEVSRVSQSSVLSVTFEGGDQEQAVQILEEVFRAYTDLSTARLADPAADAGATDDERLTVAVFDPAHAVGRVGPNIRRNVVVASLLGLIAGFGLAFLRHGLDRSPGPADPLRQTAGGDA